MAKGRENKKLGKKERRIVLLDAHAILHRAYHALPDFSSSRGEPTGALYGVSTMLIKTIGELKPDYIVACFDLPEPTYRHQAYEDYKAGRKKAEDDLIMQIKRSYDIFEAFGIPTLSAAGFEADDVLGTLVEKLKKEKNLDVIIASGDMDTLQLVDDDKVKVYTLKKGIKETVMYDEDGVMERFGFSPNLLADFKGLRGDPSDNIIGIAGIGDKTASVLIQKFGSIEDIYKKLKKDKKSFEKAGIKPRVIKLLEEGEEEAMFSKMLATIRCDAPVKFSLPERPWQEYFDMNKVKQIFNDLEFRTLDQRLKEVLVSRNNIDDKAEKRNGENHQSSLNGTDQLKITTIYGSESPEDFSQEEVRETALALWVLNSSITNPKIDDILNFAGTKSFARAKEKIFAELEKNNLRKVFEKIELPLIPVVEKMNKKGVKIDAEYLKKLSKDYHKKLQDIEKKIWKRAGREFNVASPKQLREVLFEELELKLPHHKKTSTGVKSTRESELEKMRDLHPIVEEILEHRELSKLLSTYIDNIPRMLSDDSRLHATFLQTGTTTGRMSSQDPNLQNIPIKSELGRNIRHAFVATEGFKLVTFDYSQIELRVAAFMSGDDKLIEVFKEGGDVHTAVASAVFNVSEKDVDYELRRKAKVINFGILYGMGVNALRANLKTTREEAQKYLNDYFEKFDGLADYLNRVKAETERKGYTETFFGRRRYFEGIKSKIPYIKAAAERMAINAPLQGTSADIIKIAMIEADRLIGKKKLSQEVFLLMQIHDELIYEVKNDLVPEISQEVKKIMEKVLDPEETKGVPLLVKAGMGDNWGKMEEVEIYNP